MPLYEYRCQECRRRSTVLVRSVASQAADPSCEHCGSGKMTRLISRFSFRRSWGDSLDFSSGAGMPDDMDDPRQMARYMRKMQSEMGEDSSPEVDEMLDQMESGELDPDDLGDDSGDGMDE